ncbi:MAG: hypothetical protein L0154_08965 [Chloroflexi bacterium]|nr:hypothetical protein [Chloroflexota bacterium]
MLRTNRIEIKYGLITSALLASLLALATTQVFSRLDTAIDDLFELMTNLGFAGFLVVALISNATLLAHVPYTVPLLSLALSGASLNHVLLMGVASGCGAAVGEMISYGITLKLLGENAIVEKSSLLQWVRRMVNSHPRMIPLLFVYAVSPLPDDTLIIPLVMVHYDMKRFLPPLLIGKLAHNLVIAAVFYYFTDIQADLALGILIVFVMAILYQVEKTRVIGPSLTEVSSATLQQ